MISPRAQSESQYVPVMGVPQQQQPQQPQHQHQQQQQQQHPAIQYSANTPQSSSSSEVPHMSATNVHYQFMPQGNVHQVQPPSAGSSVSSPFSQVPPSSHVGLQQNLNANNNGIVNHNNMGNNMNNNVNANGNNNNNNYNNNYTTAPGTQMQYSNLGSFSLPSVNGSHAIQPTMYDSIPPHMQFQQSQLSAPQGKQMFYPQHYPPMPPQQQQSDFMAQMVPQIDHNGSTNSLPSLTTTTAPPTINNPPPPMEERPFPGVLDTTLHGIQNGFHARSQTYPTDNSSRLTKRSSSASSTGTLGMTEETARRNRCTLCEKQFKRPSSLQTHIYSHTGEKPFKCTWNNCGRLFSVRSNMIRHRKLHDRDASSIKNDDDTQTQELKMANTLHREDVTNGILGAHASTGSVQASAPAASLPGLQSLGHSGEGFQLTTSGWSA